MRRRIAFRKIRSKTLKNGAWIAEFAKGAGMIEPNMATMSPLMTDAIPAVAGYAVEAEWLVQFHFGGR
jgi:N-acetylglutamate synthase/N-acetylornithine aminotransferase